MALRQPSRAVGAKPTPYRNCGSLPADYFYRLGVAEGDGPIDPLGVGDASDAVLAAGVTAAPEAGAVDETGDGFADC